MRAHSPVLSRHDVQRLSAHGVSRIVDTGNVLFSSGLSSANRPLMREVMDEIGGEFQPWILRNPRRINFIDPARMRLVRFFPPQFPSIDDTLFNQLNRFITNRQWSGRTFVVAVTSLSRIDAFVDHINQFERFSGMTYGKTTIGSGFSLGSATDNTLMDGIRSIAMGISLEVFGGEPLVVMNGKVVMAHSFRGGTDWVYFGNNDFPAAAVSASFTPSQRAPWTQLLRNMMTKAILN